jgi:mercuric ion transport protein
MRDVGTAGAAVAGGGAAVGAAAASACCVGPVISPLIVSVLGAGGAAWAAGLKPYSPYLLGGALIPLLYGFWAVYRRPRACATTDGTRVRERSPIWLRAILWTAGALWLTALAANLFLGSP